MRGVSRSASRETSSAQREELHHQRVTVTVHHQSGQTIGFSMDQPAGGGVRADKQVLPFRDGLLQAPLPEIGTDFFLCIPREQPYDDLRAVIKVTPRQPVSARVLHIHDIAINRIPIHPFHRAREDPGMPPEDGSFPARPENHRTSLHLTFSQM